MIRKILFIILLLCVGVVFAQENESYVEPTFQSEDKAETKIYSFPVFAGQKEMMPMWQIDTLFFSSYKLSLQTYSDCFRYEDKKNWQKVLIILPPVLLDYFVFVPLTHEEAHRAILTSQGIGSISQPFMKMEGLMGAAYVKGVADKSLINLRDSNLPMFIRMHTAGIESDYILMQKSFQDMAFGTMDLNSDMLLAVDWISRTFSLLTYLSSGLVDSVFSGVSQINGLKEESNELDRDIVGHDVYGMIHHLYEPEAEYKRYITFADLNNDERNFAKRVGWKSLLNLPILTPIWFGKTYFDLGGNHTLSFNTGYALAPFGDFIDENFYYVYKGLQNPLRLSFYARQYQNKSNWFPAFGLKVLEYSAIDWIVMNAEAHIWVEPENLDFNISVGKFGCAFGLEAMFIPHIKKKSNIGDLGLSVGFLYKTAGFLPEVESHDSYWRLTLGIVYRN